MKPKRVSKKRFTFVVPVMGQGRYKFEVFVA
jgi:hypothetical protein